MRLSILAAALLLGSSQALAAATKDMTLDVQNMTCSLCPITVKKALEKTPGVTKASIDFDKKTATVTFDPDRTTERDLTKATTEAGFPSVVRHN